MSWSNRRHCGLKDTSVGVLQSSQKVCNPVGLPAFSNSIRPDRLGEWSLLFWANLLPRITKPSFPILVRPNRVRQGTTALTGSTHSRRWTLVRAGQMGARSESNKKHAISLTLVDVKVKMIFSGIFLQLLYFFWFLAFIYFFLVFWFNFFWCRLH